MFSLSLLSWVLKFTKPYKFKLFFYFLFELLTLLFSLLFIWFSKQSIDHAVGYNNGEIVPFLIATVLSLLFSFSFAQLATFCCEKNKALLLADLHRQILKKQIFSPWQNNLKHTGDLMVRILNDTQEIVAIVGQIGISSIISLIKIITMTGFLYWMDPKLAGILLLLTPCVLLSKFYFRKLRSLQKSLKFAESQFGKSMQDNLRLRLLIRAMNQDNKRWVGVENDINNIYNIKNTLLNFSSFSKVILSGIFILSYSVAFVWGILKLEQGLITVGSMSAFLQLVIRIQSPVVSLMGYLPTIVRSTNSFERIEEILKEPEVGNVTAIVLEEINQLKLSNLFISSGERWLIHGLDFDFNRGLPTIVLGASGTGKTTLLRSILALISPEKGSVVLNSKNLSYTMNESFRCNFSYVPQGEKIFNGTILDNLLFGNESLDKESLTNILYDACAEFVFDLPDGLDTVVGESGFGLSEGQIQRLAVARAILQPTKVWLFDEITSALDSETAHTLVQRLIKAGSQKIIIFITHDKSLQNYFDQTLDIQRLSLININ